MIRVLVAPGKTVPLKELSEKEQAEVALQLKLVSECPEISEYEEWEF